MNWLELCVNLLSPLISKVPDLISAIRADSSISDDKRKELLKALGVDLDKEAASVHEKTMEAVAADIPPPAPTAK